jgi:hypothetical protein
MELLNKYHDEALIENGGSQVVKAVFGVKK